MSIESIQYALKERFAAPLPEFYQRRIVFWQDEEREFEAIAVVGSLENQKNTLPTSPCGVCRQALFEFGGNDLRVILAKSEDDYQVCTLGDLLPIGFGPKNIEH